jgi:hypothetical protein
MKAASRAALVGALGRRSLSRTFETFSFRASARVSFLLPQFCRRITMRARFSLERPMHQW